MTRLADPHAELPIKNFKYVKNCTEMYLSKRKIERIANFEPFVNLEVLWINDNEIEALDGLDTCVRIKYLYAQNNRIRTLESSSLKHFTFLKELRLYGNKLKDLHGTLAVLSKLHHLEDLDLFENPVQEEENYRLQVIKMVPSLLVLDRHVITDEERVKAERFRLVSHDVDTLRDTSSSKPDAAKKKRMTVIAGAPPQEMSGTVKMLFREVAAIKREQKTRDHEAAERELLDLSNAHMLLSSNSRTSKLKRTGIVENLDDWEVAALRKRFHALEEKKNCGAKRIAVSELLEYLASRGYLISVDGKQLSSDFSLSDLDAAVKTLFPSDETVVWASVMQCFETRRISCKLMSTAELMKKAARCFSKSEELQSRIRSMTTSDPTHQQLVKESLELSQQAYHLQTLAEKQDSDLAAPTNTGQLAPMEKKKTGGAEFENATLAAPKTKFFVTSYGREAATAPVGPVASGTSKPFVAKFHELKEQSAQVDSALAAKYKLHQKDYAKYLEKKHHTPHSTKLVKHTFHL